MTRYLFAPFEAEKPQTTDSLQQFINLDRFFMYNHRRKKGQYQLEWLLSLTRYLDRTNVLSCHARTATINLSPAIGSCAPSIANRHLWFDRSRSYSRDSFRFFH